MTKGIDISYHQGTIDFAKVKKAGIDFAILRSSYRTTKDSKFFEYVKGCLNAGIQIVGVYHFSYALNETQAKAEADLAASLVKYAGLPISTYIFFDFEYDTVTKAKKNNGITLGKTDCNKHTRAFCERVKSLGYPTGIYTNIDYYKNWYTKDTLNSYPIWLADYTGGPDYSCMIQQYSSKGKVNGISGYVDVNYWYGDSKSTVSNKSTVATTSVKYSRQAVVSLAQSWVGKKESDGSYKTIIDIYNSYKGTLPRNAKMKYSYPWCACTWSALAIKLGYTEIMPIEISCGYLIEAAKKKGIWVENDAYVPSPGDAILYDWDDTGKGDDTKWPDHVGVVEKVNKSSGYFTVIEGNYSDQVKRRTVSINGKFIRGFITPKYDSETLIIADTTSGAKDIITVAREVIAGDWGNGSDRKKNLEAAGYNYADVQAQVNKILSPSEVSSTTKRVKATCAAKKKDNKLSGTYKVKVEGTNCRNDAGTNKKSLVQLPKGTEVENYGYYNLFNGVKWLYVQFKYKNVEYTGFISSTCLTKE